MPTPRKLRTRFPMKMRIPVLQVLAAILTAAVAVWLYSKFVGGNGDRKLAVAAPSQSTTRELHFTPGSPQLSFIKVEAVQALPEPLIEPLNARVAYDENHTVRLSSPIAGRITRIQAQPGDHVVAGQPLATLDSPEFAAAAADLGKSSADLQQKRKGYARSDEAYKAGVIPRKDFEEAETELRLSEAENTRARLRMRNLDPGAGGTGSATFTLRAPISGIVAERNVNPGTEVRPDAPNPLFVITDPAHLWVMIDLPERYLGKVRVGQKVTIEVDAYQGGDFWGQIVSIGEVLDPATRRVQVRCVVDNKNHLLKPEMYARVTPIEDDRVRLPRIQNSALITQGLYSYVFVEKEPGLFAKRQVTLGLQGRSESYVKQGLEEGERVVGTGALLLNSELAGGG